MFNVNRKYPAPTCLNDEKYNTHEVVNLLEPMFFGKCYLCERDALFDPEIEHFEPHQGDKAKKYDWNNLYYACSRCNSIKGVNHKNLLDCCDENINVFKAIKCLVPSIPDQKITVEATVNTNDAKTINTVRLLDKCYNEKNTAIRGVTRSVLIETIFEHYTKFLKYRASIKSKESTPNEKQHAKDRIEAMLKVDFPFSVFWRWHVLCDSFLNKELESSIDFYK